MFRELKKKYIICVVAFKQMVNEGHIVHSLPWCDGWWDDGDYLAQDKTVINQLPIGTYGIGMNKHGGAPLLSWELSKWKQFDIFSFLWISRCSDNSHTHKSQVTTLRQLPQTWDDRWFKRVTSWRQKWCDWSSWSSLSFTQQWKQRCSVVFYLKENNAGGLESAHFGKWSEALWECCFSPPCSEETPFSVKSVTREALLFLIKVAELPRNKNRSSSSSYGSLSSNMHCLLCSDYAFSNKIWIIFINTPTSVEVISLYGHKDCLYRNSFLFFSNRRTCRCVAHAWFCNYKREASLPVRLHL